ncbi:MAG: hypothetical protein INR62_11475 [Rhodospirillales bacterium]|nr:hypothetical protein [Acetobacter sp.]
MENELANIAFRVKRAPYEPDPAVLQSLNDKIDAWQRQRDTATQPEPIAS